MNNKEAWEREYKDSTFLTKKFEPQKSVVDFFKFLRKKEGVICNGKRLLDLGCGIGRNSFYAESLGFSVTGIDISNTAISLGLLHAQEIGSTINLQQGSMGEKFPYKDEEFDCVLDVTSSNSLNENEREIYIQEMCRTLKQGGYLYVRALCKDGDANAKILLQTFAGKEKDTYVLPEQKITERVWTKKEFIEYYERYFKIIFLEIKESYTRMGDRTYKRRFIVCYMKK